MHRILKLTEEFEQPPDPKSTGSGLQPYISGAYIGILMRQSPHTPTPLTHLFQGAWKHPPKLSRCPGNISGDLPAHLQKNQRKSLKTPLEPRWNTLRRCPKLLGTLLGPVGESPKMIQKVVQLGPIVQPRSDDQLRSCPTYIFVQFRSDVQLRSVSNLDL